MRKQKQVNPLENGERRHLLEVYRMLVNSVREAQSMQSVLWKEQQMKRLLRQLRGAA